MELTDMEKRLVYQMEGYERSDVLRELHMCIPYIPDPQKRNVGRELLRKLEDMPEKECSELIRDIRENYRLPKGPKTVGELLAEARQRSGAKRLKGHDIMALERFAEDTRHMVIFDVVSSECPVGDKGDRMRLFLTDDGYRKFQESQDKGFIRIRNHAKVSAGYLHYDHRDRGL